MRAIAARFRPNFVKQDFARPNFAKPKLKLSRVVWQGIALMGLTWITGYTTGTLPGMGIAAAIEIIRSGINYIKGRKADLDPYSKPADFLPVQDYARKAKKPDKPGELLPIQTFNGGEKGRFRWIA